MELSTNCESVECSRPSSAAEDKVEDGNNKDELQEDIHGDAGLCTADRGEIFSEASLSLSSIISVQCTCAVTEGFVDSAG